MRNVEEFVTKYTDSKVMESFSKKLDEGANIMIIFGKVTYSAINHDPYAKAAYESMIQRGANIAFNPMIEGYKDMNIFDKKNIGVLNRLSGMKTEITNSFFVAQEKDREIKNLYENSLSLKNFDEPVEKLTEYFEKHSSGLKLQI